MLLTFLRFNEKARMPVRKHFSDTGADIFMPCGGTIKGHETKVIPLGFGIDIPNGYSMRIQVRTSLAKEGIMVQGCAIDAGYTGEISMILHNLSDTPFTWREGDRLAYLEMYQIIYPQFTDVDCRKRGDGAFGSTGR